MLDVETGKFAVSGGEAQMAKHSAAAAHMTSGVRYLPIPLDIGNAPIPVGMSEEDFKVLEATLKLWENKIVRSEPSDPEPSSN
jgi:hypothetical protein